MLNILLATERGNYKLSIHVWLIVLINFLSIYISQYNFEKNLQGHNFLCKFTAIDIFSPIRTWKINECNSYTKTEVES
jgi:hypothetical protein